MNQKTIFISLLAHGSIGNFSIPDGVFERLVKQKTQDTRIVLLVSKADLYDKIRNAPYVADGSVTVAMVPNYEPKRFSVKLFRFFYSYLIFTGTTRTLATLGARADMPPAGGNRHLAPVKWLIANTLGRSRWVKTRLVPWLFDRVFTERPYAPVFERYRPALVFAANAAFVHDSELIAEAARRGIRTVAFVCNWDHLNKYFIPRRADTLLVQNEPMRREAGEFQGYAPEQITVTGFPKFDLYHAIAKHAATRAEFFRHFGMPEHAKLVLFISGSAYSLDEADILRTIAGWIRAGRFTAGDGVRLLVRPYVTLRDRKQEEEKYKTLAGDPLIAFNWIKGDVDEESRRLYLGMLRHADVVISMFSTTAIEAALLDKPTIAIGFDGYAKRPPHQTVRRMERMHHFRNVLDTGNVRVVRSFDQLFELMNVYLADPAKDREKRRELVEKLCVSDDGLSSKRVSDAILSLLP